MNIHVSKKNEKRKEKIAAIYIYFSLIGLTKLYSGLIKERERFICILERIINKYCKM